MSWYVVRTKPHKEAFALRHLMHKGFETYMPRYRKQIRHARKSQIVLRPFLPGYLFVRGVGEQQSWHNINNSLGVISLIKFSESPATLDDDVIEGLRSRENACGEISMVMPRFKKGASVRIREGAFANYVALLEEESDGKRAMLLINIMGREARVSTSIENLALTS